MPERKTVERARQAKREGKSATTQAGEFVREEIHHVREGKHGARSAKQAIAIGLSKARRAGVSLPPPKRGAASVETRERAQRDLGAPGGKHTVSRKRSQATKSALKREPRRAASHKALATQAHRAAARHSSSERSSAARRAARTKGPVVRSNAARKAARTRAALQRQR